MTKSAIILLAALWLLCTIYMGLSAQYGLPYQHAAMIGSWVVSALLLVYIIIFIKKHRDGKKG